MAREPIRFLLPEPLDQLPTDIDGYWDWQISAKNVSPWWGRYHWVLQTYLRLKAAGYPCELCRDVPAEGVVVTHRDCLSASVRPTPNRFIVALLVDRLLPHPYAQLHIVHRQGQSLGPAWSAEYLPPRPQVSLLPRALNRGDRFETVGFFGYEQNLAAPFVTPEFRRELHARGLHFVLRSPAEWNDFRDVDAVLAIRSVGRVDVQTKSAIKLINAWHAGVPAVLGRERGFHSVRQSDLDYLEATTPQEALSQLGRLAEDRDLRQEMVANGYRRAGAFSAEATTTRWIELLDTVVRPMREQWRMDGAARLRFQVRREMARAATGLVRRAAMYGGWITGV